MKYKAIISDFDGTLADINWQISQTVETAISRWINSGRYFSIATGKQYKHIQQACKLLKLTTPQIVRGGAEIVDGSTGTVIHSAYLDPRELKQLVALLLKNTIPFTAEQGNILYTLTGQPLTAVPNVEYKKIHDMPFTDIAKIVLWTDSLQESDVENFVQKHIHGKFHTIEIIKSYSPSNKSWQITSVQGTKYSAVAKLAQILNVQTNSCIGIGDSYNDYPLLSACGYKVAMGNAPEQLKEIADFIAPSYSQDGVAVAIDKFIPR